MHGLHLGRAMQSHWISRVGLYSLIDIKGGAIELQPYMHTGGAMELQHHLI